LFSCIAHLERVYRPFQFQKRTQQFIGTHNETFSGAVCATNIKAPLTSPTREYCPSATAVGIKNKGLPPPRVGKSLDLPLSFRKFDLLAWPVAIYIMLKKDAEFSLF
jgi:hypothetical protein